MTNACHCTTGVVAVAAENPVRSLIYWVDLLWSDARRSIGLSSDFVFYSHAALKGSVVVVVDNLSVWFKPEVTLGLALFFRVRERQRLKVGILSIHSVDLFLSVSIVDIQLAKALQIGAVGSEVFYHLSAELCLEVGRIIHVKLLLVPVGRRIPLDRAKSG